jgi:hypothetical protein
MDHLLTFTEYATGRMALVSVHIITAILPGCEGVSVIRLRGGVLVPVHGETEWVLKSMQAAAQRCGSEVVEEKG